MNKSSTYRRLDQIRILHDLRKQKTLLHVLESTAALDIDIVDGAEARADARGGVDGDEGIPGPVAVHLIAGGPEG